MHICIYIYIHTCLYMYGEKLAAGEYVHFGRGEEQCADGHDASLSVLEYHAHTKTPSPRTLQ